MEYTNNKIKQLIKDRDALIQKYNNEIQKEIEKEKGKYYFSYKHFFLMVGSIVFMLLAVEANKKIFPKTSIFSWGYYAKYLP